MAYLPTLVAAVVAILGVFTPQTQALIAAHPAIVAVLGAIATVITHLLPSPVADK